MALGVLSCGLFAAIVTQGTGRLLEAEAFGDFYDFQAKSLLEGRLDVPVEAIQFEAWLVPPVARPKYASLRWKVDSLFGVKNPAGYNASELPVRNVDV